MHKGGENKKKERRKKKKDERQPGRSQIIIDHTSLIVYLYSDMNVIEKFMIDN